MSNQSFSSNNRNHSKPDTWAGTASGDRSATNKTQVVSPGTTLVRGAHLLSLVRTDVLRVALVKEGDKPLGLPGGKLEPFETPQEALARELLEECNCDVPALDLNAGWRSSSETVGSTSWEANYVQTNRSLPNVEYWPIGSVACGVSNGQVQPYVWRVINHSTDGALMSSADQADLFRRFATTASSLAVANSMDALLVAQLPKTQVSAISRADVDAPVPPTGLPPLATAMAARAVDYTAFDHTQGQTQAEFDRRNAKTALNNAAQAGHWPNPVYSTTQTGPSHAPVFTSRVRVGELAASGVGVSKTDAEAAAAAKALSLMGSFNPYGNGQPTRVADAGCSSVPGPAKPSSCVAPRPTKKEKGGQLLVGPGSSNQKKFPGPGHALTLLVLLGLIASTAAQTTSLVFMTGKTSTFAAGVTTTSTVQSAMFTSRGEGGVVCNQGGGTFTGGTGMTAATLGLLYLKRQGAPVPAMATLTVLDSTVTPLATYQATSAVAVTGAVVTAQSRLLLAGVYDLVLTIASDSLTTLTMTYTAGTVMQCAELVNAPSNVTARAVSGTVQNVPFWVTNTKPLAADGAAEADQAGRNKAAHALNGNTSTESPGPHFFDPLHENDRQNPFAEFDEEKFDEELCAAVRVLPPSAMEFALCVIDDRHDYLAANGFVYSSDEALEREVAVAKAVAAPKEATRVNGAPPTKAAKIEAEGPHEGRRRVDMMKRLRAMASRVVARCKSWGHVVDWLNGGDPPSHDVVKAVVEEAERVNLPSKEGADYWIASCMAAERTRRTTFEGLTNWSRPLATLASGPTWKKWIDRRFPALGPRVPTKVEIVGQATFDAAARRPLPTAVAFDERSVPKTGSFNAYGNQQRASYAEPDLSGVPKTGSFNAYGNEQMADWSFPNAMSDIAAAGALRPLVEAEGAIAGPVMNPIVEVEMLTGLRGEQGVTMSSVPRETALRGGTISTANAVTVRNDLNHPEALLYPLQVRNGAGAALIASTRRPATFGVGQVRRTALRPSVESAEGAAIREQVARGGAIRAEQVTLQCARTVDAAALLRLEPDMDGDSIAVPLTKLLLYEASRSWLQDAAFLPIGGEAGKFDSYTQLDVNPAVAVGYNDAPSFGLNNGGAAAPTLPFTTTVPRVAFHVARATIPYNEPWTFVPPGQTLQNDRGSDSLNYALEVLSKAPFPIGTHTVVLPTLDDAGGNAANQTFIPHSDLVHIAGVSTLHVLLATNPGDVPRTQAAANAMPLVPPMAGPTLWGAIAANAALDVSWMAAGVPNITYYSMAEYLGTWMALPNSPIDVTTLVRFRKQMAELLQREKDMQFAWELVSTLVARYPAMVESVVGTPTKFAANSAASVAVQNFMSLKPLVMAANAPLDVTSYDWYLPSTNFLWEAKIKMGMYVPTPDTGVQPPPNRPFDGSPRTLQYMLHTVRDYAVTWEVMLTYMMQSKAVWDSAFTQQNYVGVLEQIRDFFTEAQRVSNDGVILSEQGYALAVLHCRVNGAQPAVDMYGHSLWEYLNVPRVGFLAPLSTAGAELANCVPCVLPDIWLQTELKQNIRALSPMLSPQKLLTGLKVDDGQVTPLGAGSYTTPITIETQPREVGIDTVPLLNDDMRFNDRLVWHTFTASMFTLDGTAFAVDLPASGRVIAQKAIVADWTVPNLLLPSVLNAKTAWMPFMTTLGLRLAVGVTAANGAALMTQVMAAKTTTGVATWLVRNARAMPNTIVDGGGRNRVSKIPRRVKAENSTPSSGTASAAGQEASN